MGKNDSFISQRNKRIQDLSNQIKSYIPSVLEVTGYESELSLNATYGGKMQEYANVKYNSYRNEEDFINSYFTGFMQVVENLDPETKKQSKYYRALRNVSENKNVKEWLILFLRRAFLKNYDAYTRQKPANPDEALIWIGQENANYGIGITPRFRNGQWENDQSEIRRFNQRYFSIGHILKTGLLIPNEDKIIAFSNVDSYLNFFSEVIVRLSKSKHEKEIADRYCHFVLESTKPEEILLLIPELRYKGISRKHLYRLDFCVLDYERGQKVGFELSPWSTHGQITHTRTKTQSEINEEAMDNFHDEISKYRKYFIKYGITILAYTDPDLIDYDHVFNDIKPYLLPERTVPSFSTIEDTLRLID